MTTAALRGTALVAARGLAIRVLGLLGTLVLTRLLTPHDFGSLAIAVALFVAATLLADGGLGASLIQRKDPPTREELRALQGFQLTATVVLVVIGGLATLPFGATGRVTLVVLLCLPIASLQAPGAILLERGLDYGPKIRVELVENLAYVLLSVAAAAAGWGALGVAAAFPLRGIVGTLMMRSVSPVGLVPPSWDWDRMRGLLGFGLRYQAVSVTGLARDLGTSSGISLVAGLPLLGQWSLAYRIIQVPVLLFEALWRVSFPAMSRMLGTDASPAVFLNRCLRLGGTCAALILVPIAGATAHLVPLAFGARWVPAAAVLPWAWGSLMLGGPISIALAGFLYASGNAQAVFLAGGAQAVLTLAVGLPLLPVLGLQGMGVALLLATLADIVILVRAARREADIRLLPTLGLPTAAALLAGTGGYLLGQVMAVTWLACVTGGATALALFVAILLVGDATRLTELSSVGRRALGRSHQPPIRRA